MTGGTNSAAVAAAAHTCPLCGESTVDFHTDRTRAYRRCPGCALIAVPPQYWLDAASEKARYDEHDNGPADAGYRRFLSRTSDAVRARVALPARGLDFGSGPGPTLSVMLEEAGYGMALYDPFYSPDESVFDTAYDFITATEVFEHLRAPATDLQRLLGCLRPGGWLVIMTKRARDREAFSSWHYILDPTHIIFFSEETFRWIATQWDLHLEMVGRDVVALCKRS